MVSSRVAFDTRTVEPQAARYQTALMLGRGFEVGPTLHPCRRTLSSV